MNVVSLPHQWHKNMEGKSKKELKLEYKELKPVMGVFQIKNTSNGKALIEKSLDIHAKWNRHQTELNFGSHRNKALQMDWVKYKSEAFEFSILSELEHDSDKEFDYNDDLKTLEKMVTEELNLSKPSLY